MTTVLSSSFYSTNFRLDEELDQMMKGIAPSSRKLMSRHPRKVSNQPVINPFNPIGLFLYPLKTSENVRCFQGLLKETSGLK